jgi:hypothetical protein
MSLMSVLCLGSLVPEIIPYEMVVSILPEKISTFTYRKIDESQVREITIPNINANHVTRETFCRTLGFADN